MLLPAPIPLRDLLKDASFPGRRVAVRTGFGFRGGGSGAGDEDGSLTGGRVQNGGGRRVGVAF
jgi:hypothetical protein